MTSLRELSIAKKVDTLEKMLTSIKSNQKMGEDIGVIHEISTANASDVSIPPYGTVYRYFIFVPDRQLAPLSVIRFQVGNGTISNTANPIDFSIAAQDLSMNEPPSSQNRLVIGVNLYSVNNNTILFKAYAFATDAGTLYIKTSYLAGDIL